MGTAASKYSLEPAGRALVATGVSPITKIPLSVQTNEEMTASGRVLEVQALAVVPLLLAAAEPWYRNLWILVLVVTPADQRIRGFASVGRTEIIEAQLLEVELDRSIS